MKFGRRLTGMLLVLILGMLALSGGALAEEQALDQETLNAGDVTLRISFWAKEENAKKLIQALDDYSAMYPNITIEPEYITSGYQEKLITQLAAGTEPDIMQIDQPWLAQLARTDSFVDLYEYKDIFNADDVLDQDQIERYCLVDGKMLAASSGGTFLSGILVHPAAEEVGFDIEKYGVEGLTWDILLEEGKRIHEEHPDYYLGAPDAGLLLWQVKTMVKQLSGNDIVLDDYTFGCTEEQLLKVYQDIWALYENGVYEPFNKTMLFEGRLPENPTLTTGHLVMQLVWASNIDAYPGYLPEGYSVTAFLYPSYGENQVEEAGRTLVRPNHVNAVSKHSQNVREAVKLLDYLLTDETVAQTIGVTRGYSTASTHQKVFAEHPELCSEQYNLGFQMANANALTKESVILGKAELEACLKDEISKLAYGELTPEEAVKSTMKNVGSLLEQLKTNG